MKLRHILGTVTIVAIAGGTIYAIKKSKDLKKAEGEEITLAEAKEIVAEREAAEGFEKSYKEHFGDDIKFAPRFEDEVMTSVSAYAQADVKATHAIYADLEDDEDIDETIEGPSIEDDFKPQFQPVAEETDDDIGIFTEEDRTLRYEPSSVDALKQFKRMELADLVHNDDTYQTLLRLFDFPFLPQNDGDEMLRTQLIDYRVQFFGFGSKWAQRITFADVILHYARAAEFNQGESVGYWVDYFLEFNDLWHQYSSQALDLAIDTLNKHKYFNEERATFGLFGLTRESMDQAIKIANRNIDRSVTYEIEFNEFLKSCL
jgi:hypothetical protein